MSLRLLLLCCLISIQGYAQISTDSAAFFIKDIYRQTLSEEKAYTWLTTLTKDIGNRLSGSENSLKAIEWAKATMDTLGFDSVWLQPVMVPHWERGVNEQVVMVSNKSVLISSRHWHSVNHRAQARREYALKSWK